MSEDAAVQCAACGEVVRFGDCHDGRRCSSCCDEAEREEVRRC